MVLSIIINSSNSMRTILAIINQTCLPKWTNFSSIASGFRYMQEITQCLRGKLVLLRGKMLEDNFLTDTRDSHRGPMKGSEVCTIILVCSVVDPDSMLSSVLNKQTIVGGVDGILDYEEILIYHTGLSCVHGLRCFCFGSMT